MVSNKTTLVARCPIKGGRRGSTAVITGLTPTRGWPRPNSGRMSCLYFCTSMTARVKVGLEARLLDKEERLIGQVKRQSPK